MFRIATALTALAALATAAPAPQSSRGITSGSLTWYTEGIGSAFTACGTMVTLTDHIAALSEADYGVYANPNESPVCGKKIRVHGPNGNSVLATVADRCAGCATGDVDVTPVVFAELGYSQDIGRVGVSWNFEEA
ncbi:riboflavin aldehyde-forming enzyme [Diaporthe eres]|uniref:RlpA-like protein double-psi beta-barrel domain-containing protein n=1 Tax=Diaporthe vaccinii TaxID=105482 RepID=A0ABR4ELI3_9PEZI|nr:riboflavin aldehyde-forming enzyme [Diaporthe eres]